MDVWEANMNGAAVTPHVCNVQGQTRCSGTQCGEGDERYDGICDKDGCDFNSWRMGDQTFLGPGKTVDTSSKFTVVTQFLTSDNTTSGTLSEIRRLYVQNGRVTVSGESRFENEDRKEDGYVLRERRFGRFSRSLPVPQGIKVSAIV